MNIKLRFNLELVEKYGSPNERKYSPRKCYCADNGFRVVMIGTRGIGSLAENLVFNLLRQRADVNYYSKDNTEIDFISGKSAIEVKYRNISSKSDFTLLKKLRIRGVNQKLIVSMT